MDYTSLAVTMLKFKVKSLKLIAIDYLRSSRQSSAKITSKPTKVPSHWYDYKYIKVFFADFQVSKFQPCIRPYKLAQRNSSNRQKYCLKNVWWKLKKNSTIWFQKLSDPTKSHERKVTVTKCCKNGGRKFEKVNHILTVIISYRRNKCYHCPLCLRSSKEAITKPFTVPHSLYYRHSL